MQFVVNGFMRRIESSKSVRAHFSLTGARRVVIENNNYYESFEYGTGGDAYGILLERGTTRCRATNNKGWTQRHHIMLTLGANHNVISYNSTEAEYKNDGGGGTTVPDLDMHGFNPHNNLWEGNMGLTLGSDSRSNLDANVHQGRFNTYFRNRLTNTYFIQGPSQPGNFDPYRYTIVGNVIQYRPGELVGDNNFIGNNYRIDNNTILAGALNANSNVPNSLYLSSKPAFLGSKTWPLFGPGANTDGLGTYGKTHTPPARDRGKAGTILPTVNTAN
jgi:hypothetical protein